MLRVPITFACLLLLLLLHGGSGQAAVSQAFDLKVEADRLLKQGKIEQAIPLYEKALQQDAAFANTRYNLATAYYLQGKIEKAAENLEAFVNLHPNDAEVLYNLGCLKLRLGVFEEAWACFLKARGCPCSRLMSQKIKEALHFMKDLQNQNPETQQLVAYLVTGSSQGLLPN